MISGLHCAGVRDDNCQIWAADAAVDYVVVSSAPANAASSGWQQFRGLGMFPWSTLASCLNPYSYLTLRSLVKSMVRHRWACYHDVTFDATHPLPASSSVRQRQRCRRRLRRWPGSPDHDCFGMVWRPDACLGRLANPFFRGVSRDCCCRLPRTSACVIAVRGRMFCFANRVSFAGRCLPRKLQWRLARPCAFISHS